MRHRPAAQRLRLRLWRLRPRGSGWEGARGPFYGGHQPDAYPPAAERSYLLAEAEDLKARLGEVESRLAELERTGSAEA